VIVRVALAALRSAKSITEGRESVPARSLAAVLGANCLGLLPVSGSDPQQFEHLALPGSRERSDRCYSLPSMML
jgi:hypothetical protein